MIDRIEIYTPISNEEIANLWGEIKDKWENNLQNEGINLPKEGSAKMYQLVYLYKYRGKLVHKDVISDFVKEHIPTAGKDQQVRHLGPQNGFYVLNKGEEILADETVPSGFHILINLNTPSPSWQSAAKKRLSQLNASSFDEIKKLFNFRCATCGAKEGEAHRVTKKIVHLQQGHINPNKELSLDNTIPQCEYCNQNIYKDDFVFTRDGYPNKINNPKYVLRSDKSVRKEMLEILKKDQNNSNKPDQ